MEDLRSKLLEVLSLPESRLTLLIPLSEVVSAHKAIPFRCECGAVVGKRPWDIIHGAQIECSKCAGRLRMQTPTERQIQVLHENAAAMRGTKRNMGWWANGVPPTFKACK